MFDPNEINNREITKPQIVELIKSLLTTKNYSIKGNELSCCCPFHDDKHPSFGINLKTYQYNCFSCEAKGDLVKFVSELSFITKKEAIELLEAQTEYEHDREYYYTVEDYANEKRLNQEELNCIGVKTSASATKIEIPYHDENNNFVRVRYRNNPNNPDLPKNKRFYWSEGDKIIPYGLWQLNDFIEKYNYVVIVEGESDCHTLWTYDIPAIGVPGATAFKKDYVKYFEKIDTIYVHMENDDAGKEFVNNVAKVLAPKEVYVVSACKVEESCKDPSELHIRGLFNKEKFFETAEAIKPDVMKGKEFKHSKKKKDNEIPIHVQIADEILQLEHIKFYKQNFYVYNNGVYKEGLNIIEKRILEIDNTVSKHIQSEVLNYIRILQNCQIVEMNEDYINFKNGLYGFKANKLIPHTPEYFTTCQVNANYIDPKDLVRNKYVDNFLSSVCCRNENRITALLQMTGYSMTFRTNIGKAFFLYGPSAKNGKSTFIELFITTIGKENVSHLTFHQLTERFSSSDIMDKLVNTETEVSQSLVKNIEVFKKLVTGDEFAIEEKYKKRVNIKPFAKFIYATNTLPNVHDDDNGYYRRIYIIPFYKKITDEEEISFDKSKILTPEAIDYFANISLQAYRNIGISNKLATQEESNKLLAEYRSQNDTIEAFLKDENMMKRIFCRSNRTLKTAFYGRYAEWCKELDQIPRKKSVFYIEILTHPEYIERYLDGKTYIEDVHAPKQGYYEKNTF